MEKIAYNCNTFNGNMEFTGKVNVEKLVETITANWNVFGGYFQTPIERLAQVKEAEVTLYLISSGLDPAVDIYKICRGIFKELEGSDFNDNYQRANAVGLSFLLLQQEKYDEQQIKDAVEKYCWESPIFLRENFSKIKKYIEGRD